MNRLIVLCATILLVHGASLPVPVPVPVRVNEQDALSRNPLARVAPVQMIRDFGYPVEEHEVQTSDGYLLTMHRIPYGLAAGAGEAAGKTVVFVQHGLLCSSADWVVSGPKKGLAFILADAGYDVWMGNARGNTHSRKHISMSPNSRAFWDFSWNEIGRFDLPAMIDYTLAATGQSGLHYVGHSQGTTSFFVMGSLRPEYNPKIRSMHALAPVAFMSNLLSPFVRALSPIVDQVELVLDLLGVYEFMPSSDMMEKGGYFLCRDEALFQEVCANVLFLIGGFNSNELNRTMLPDILANTPAGAAVGQLVHYGQGVNSGKFRQYDFGLIGNMATYGQISPPDYDLGQITAPVALHYSDNDWLAAIKDVDELSGKLGNMIGKFRVADAKWNHLDYQWGINADKQVYDRVLSLIARY